MSVRLPATLKYFLSESMNGMCVDALRSLKQALQFQDFNIQIWYRGHTESKIMQS